MSSVRRSLALSALDSYIGMALQIASTVILSRLLSPNEVGIFAIGAALMAIAGTVRDFGMGEYLIQAKELNYDRFQSAYGVNIIVSWTVAAVLLAISPLAAAVFRSEGIAEVIRVLTLCPLILPFGAVAQYWFRRQLNYVPIVTVNLIASVVVFVTAVGLTLGGYGYISLAWSMVAGAVVTVVGSWFAWPKDLPRLPAFKNMGEPLAFGRRTTGMYLLMQIGRSAPELIIGRFGSLADAGIFSRANGLVEMLRRLLLKPAMQVCLPYLAQAQRNQGSLNQAYPTAVGLLTILGWPLLAFMAIHAPVIVQVMYGPQWSDAIPIARALCLACAIELLYFLSREALLARGNATAAMRQQAQIVALQFGGLLLAIPYGMHGAAWGLIGASCIGAILIGATLSREVGVEFKSMARECRSSAIVTALTCIPAGLTAHFAPPEPSRLLAWTIGDGLLTIGLWAVGVRLLQHSAWTELVAMTRSRRRAD